MSYHIKLQVLLVILATAEVCWRHAVSPSRRSIMKMIYQWDWRAVQGQSCKTTHLQVAFLSSYVCSAINGETIWRFCEPRSWTWELIFSALKRVQALDKYSCRMNGRHKNIFSYRGLGLKNWNILIDLNISFGCQYSENWDYVTTSCSSTFYILKKDGKIIYYTFWVSRN